MGHLTQLLHIHLFLEYLGIPREENKMEETLLGLLSGLASWVPSALAWLGALVVTLKMVVKLTPTGKDDALVAKMDSIPFLGGLLAGLASRAPKADE